MSPISPPLCLMSTIKIYSAVYFPYFLIVVSISFLYFGLLSSLEAFLFINFTLKWLLSFKWDFHVNHNNQQKTPKSLLLLTET